MGNFCFLGQIFVISIFISISLASLPCALREYSTGLVCVCNDTYCDTIDDSDLHPKTDDDIIIISSSKAGLRFKISNTKWSDSRTTKISDHQSRQHSVTLIMHDSKTFNFNFKYLIENVTIRIDDSKKYQKMIGFGGALTGAVSYNLDQLSINLQNSLYKSYYSDSEGIGYNIIRIPIGGCDFDLQPWAYNSFPENDRQLSNFTDLDPRDKKIVEKIKIIQQIAGQNLKIKGASWSPPVWMKTNNKWTGPSLLKQEYYQTWADYHLKYLELMSKNGINFWAISTGNEPMNGVIGWMFVKFMSLGWTSRKQGKWISENLGPTIRNSQFKDIKLLVGDDQRFVFPWFFKNMKNAYPKTFDFIDGFGVHWYWDGLAPPQLLDETVKEFPGKILITTESSLGDKPFQVHGPILGSWERGMEYTLDYMQNFNHYVQGWIDWNLLLDETGGPNYVNNTVDSAVIVNATSNEAYKQPIFYAIGHFSKFVKPDSIRIDSISDHPEVEIVSFERPDNTIVVIVHNKNLTNGIRVQLQDRSKGVVKSIELPPSSLHTIIYSK